jgi:hypothetical protein
VLYDAALCCQRAVRVERALKVAGNPQVHKHIAGAGVKAHKFARKTWVICERVGEGAGGGGRGVERRCTSRRNEREIRDPPDIQDGAACGV